MPEPVCQWCGGPIPPPHYPSRPRRFCGNPCKFAYQKEHPPRARAPRETRPCATCGEPVTFLPSQRGAGRPPKPTYAYSDTVYCSRKCKGIGHSRLMTGRRPSNGIYTSRNTFRAMIRREFYDRCAVCGWDEAPCDVCHIIARKAGGADTMDNVVMLCPNHHRVFDRGGLTVEQVQAARPSILR